MGKVPRATWLMRRQGVYYVRARVPKDLLDIIGKAEIRRSLKTGEPVEAKRRLRTMTAEIQNEFDVARRRSAQRPDAAVQPAANSGAPTDAQLRAIVGEWFAEKERNASELELSLPAWEPEGRLEVLEQDVGALTDPSDPNVMATTQGVADQLIWARGLAVSAGSPEHLQLAELVRRAFLEGARRAARRIRGDYSDMTSDPLFSAATSSDTAAPDAEPGLSFAQLIEAYQADPSRRVSAKTKANRDGMFSVLQSILGTDTMARQITRSDARRIQEYLLRLPAHASKKFRGMSIAEVVERARAENIPPMAPATVNAHMGLLSEVLLWGEREGRVAQNVARGLLVPDTLAKDKRRSFTSTELESFFNGRLYPAGRLQSGLQWVPVLCLFQGLRLAEACGLAVMDFKPVGGVDCIHVRPDADRGRRLKTPSAERIIPLHPKLVELGFPEFVAQQRKRGVTPIFDDLKPGPRCDYGAASKKLNRAIRAAGIAHRKVAFHSLRHTFTDAAREAGIPLERLQQIMGWSGRGMEAVYGSGLSARTLLSEISKVSYQLDLGHLHP
jgi:integrase